MKKNQKTIGIQVTFILEIKLQKYIFQHNMTIVQPVMRPFEPLLGWECGYVFPNVTAEKEGIYGRKPEYKTSNWYTNDPHLGK